MTVDVMLYDLCSDTGTSIVLLLQFELGVTGTVVLARMMSTRGTVAWRC